LSQDKTIEEMRGYIDENRSRYEEAKNKIENPKFVEGMFKSIKSMLDDIMSYNPIHHENGGAVASFVLGRTQVRFSGLYDDMEFMAQFEEEEKRFYEAVKELEDASEGE
jgi:hypothetical protein